MPKDQKRPVENAQYERFEQVARELGCDDDPERFAETVRKIAKAPPAHHSKVTVAKAEEERGLVIEADASTFTAALNEASALLERFPEAGESLVGLAHLPLELCVVQTDLVSASEALKFVVRLEPSDLLLRYLTALRARNADLPVVE